MATIVAGERERERESAVEIGIYNIGRSVCKR